MISLILIKIINMELFLITDKPSSQSSTKVAIIAAAGLGVLFTLYKLFSIFETEQESDNQAKQVLKPAGIYNEGNTCFVNSLLQALSSLKLFQNNLSQAMQRFRSSNCKNQELIVELHSVLKKINSNSQRITVVRLLELISEVKQGLINLQQQDAHQLFSALIGCFQQALNKQKSIDLSASAKLQIQGQVQNCMLGYTKSSIICSLCKAQTAIKIHPFSDLSLQIRPMYVFDIKSALKQYERVQRIQSFTCTSCSILQHLDKLKKSIAKLNGTNKQALTRIGQQIVEFLQNLDYGELDMSEVNQNLANFVLGFEREYLQMTTDPQRDSIFVQLQGVQTTIFKKTMITKYPKILVVHFKQLVINPETGYPQLLRKYIGFQDTLTIATKRGQRKYELTSLLTHIGNQSMGHYFTFRRLSRSTDDWYVISDSDSRKCQWSYVKNSKAYMLFYESD